MKPAAIRGLLLVAALAAAVASVALLYEHHRWSRSVEARISKSIEQLSQSVDRVEKTTHAAAIRQDSLAVFGKAALVKFDRADNPNRILRIQDIVADDTPEQLEGGWSTPTDDVEKRSPVSCRGSDKQAVIVILGQSNAANYGQGLVTAPSSVANFNIYDGRCYGARDPLLGASGTGANFATRLGTILTEKNVFSRVILAPIAVGATRVEHWAPYGFFNRKIAVLTKRLSDAGLRPDFILWHQGEANVDAVDRDGLSYRHRLAEVIGTFRHYGIDAPFFVAQATICGGPRSGSENVRTAQRVVAETGANVFSGPDTDKLGYDMRYDQCHFNEQGVIRHAEVWAEVLVNYIHSDEQARRANLKRKGN